MISAWMAGTGDGSLLVTMIDVRPAGTVSWSLAAVSSEFGGGDRTIARPIVNPNTEESEVLECDAGNVAGLDKIETIFFERLAALVSVYGRKVSWMEVRFDLGKKDKAFPPRTAEQLRRVKKWQPDSEQK